MWIILIIIAILPVLAFTLVINIADRNEKEPIGLQLGVFGMGIASIIPTLIVEIIGSAILSIFLPEDNIIYIFIDNFFVVAITEEFFKFIFMHIIIWKNRNFNYVYDGVVYAVASSLGFACLENILYVCSNVMELGMLEGFLPSVGVGISRAILSVPLHGGVAIIMGIFYGLAKEASVRHKKGKCMLFLTIGLFIPIVIHGLYDFLLSLANVFFILIFIIYVIVLYIMVTCVWIYFSKHDHCIFAMENLPQYNLPVFSYCLNNYGEAIILGIAPEQNLGEELLVPEYINGKKVAGVGRGAFSQTQFKRIFLPNHLRFIGENAFFNCSNLEYIKMPVSLGSIGDGAFANAYSLRHILLPQINQLGDYVFQGCNALKNIYYTGSKQQWMNLNLDYQKNNKFNEVTFFYNTRRNVS